MRMAVFNGFPGSQEGDSPIQSATALPERMPAVAAPQSMAEIVTSRAIITREASRFLAWIKRAIPRMRGVEHPWQSGLEAYSHANQKQTMRCMSISTQFRLRMRLPGSDLGPGRVLRADETGPRGKS